MESGEEGEAYSALTERLAFVFERVIDARGVGVVESGKLAFCAWGGTEDARADFLHVPCTCDDPGFERS